jgi:hypothetical protein
VAPTIEELEAMSDQEVRRRYNEIATNTAVGLEWYREELQHRSIARQTETLVRLTKFIALPTIANAVLVALTLFVTLLD